jgi:hypothetical protein
VNIGFSEAGARMLASTDGENLTLESISTMDDKEVKTLCQTMRKPGGGGQGTYVSTLAEVAMKTVYYISRHFNRTSRTLAVAHITLANIIIFTNHRKALDAYKEPTEMMKLSKPTPDKTLEFIEDWPENLALFNGQDGRPLTYIIRKDPIPPMEETDPAFGQTGAPFGSIRDEIEARAPHDTPEYHVDNATVFDILKDAAGDHKNVKTWIKSYARMKNGRAAWESFKNHYRGAIQMETMKVNAEKQLSTLIYSGEKPRYNFELHVSKQLQAHLDIEKAGGDMRERSKVWKLLASFQAKNLDAAIAYVQGNGKLQEIFYRAVRASVYRACPLRLFVSVFRYVLKQNLGNFLVTCVTGLYTTPK